jgi:phosphate transport system protein
MARLNLEQELTRLQHEVMAMGELVIAAILASVDSLRRRDFEAAERIIADDRAINNQRFAIENAILTAMATQQPVARDLRSLAAMLEIVTELERIGDYAKGVAKINLMLGDRPLLKPLVDIPIMADMACDMLRRALQAFFDSDAVTARAIPTEDDRVDEMYNRVARELLTFIMADPKTMEQANLLLWAAHNMERSADRVTNICERVVFTVTGSMMELDTHEEIKPHDVN